MTTVFAAPVAAPITTSADFGPATQSAVKDFQNKLTDYLSSRKSDLMAKILKEKALTDPLIAELKTAVTEFKQTYK